MHISEDATDCVVFALLCEPLRPLQCLKLALCEPLRPMRISAEMVECFVRRRNGRGCFEGHGRGWLLCVRVFALCEMLCDGVNECLMAVRMKGGRVRVFKYLCEARRPLQECFCCAVECCWSGAVPRHRPDGRVGILTEARERYCTWHRRCAWHMASRVHM